MARADAVTARPAASRAPLPFITAPRERTSTMAVIGHFRREAGGFFGRVHTLTFYLELTIVPTEPSDVENAPHYRVMRGAEDGPEVGAGWTRSSDKAGEYISLQLDDPAFEEPIRTRLFQNGDDPTSWSLDWGRARERGERA
jgi:uncharacterized protein (DUF736 family)